MKIFTLSIVLASAILMPSTVSAQNVSPFDPSIRGESYPNGWKMISRYSIPSEVIQAIKSAPTRSSFGISGLVVYNDQILKSETLTMNARSLLQMAKANCGFVAIVAKDIYIEIPGTKDEVGRITRAPDGNFGILDGTTGNSGSTGSHTDEPNGSNGGDGGVGGTGANGTSPTIPLIFIFYQNLHASNGNPATAGLLKILSDGVEAGSGGAGGRGGDGGNGATGTPAECNGFWECRAGPGQGGNGGRGGTGGKGGNGGNGGSGGDVILVGPKADWNLAGFIEVRQEAGKPGRGGLPGSSGNPGREGGGGHMCRPCNGRDAGSPGAGASPVNLGSGATGQPGARGNKAMVDRSNVDLF